MERHKPGEFALYISSKPNQDHLSPAARAQLIKMQRDRHVFGAVCPIQTGQQGRRAAGNNPVWTLSLLYIDVHSAAPYSGINRLSTCRIKCWCQEAAVQSLCTWSSPASSNKVCASLTTSCTTLPRRACVHGCISRFESCRRTFLFVLQLSRRLHGMIWKIVRPWWDVRATPWALRWDQTSSEMSYFYWVFVTPDFSCTSAHFQLFISTRERWHGGTSSSSLLQGLLMFDTMCWNPARMRLLFTRDTQTTR